MKADPLQEFILKDEQNFRIAAAISEAWPDARNRLATAFLERLTTKLLQELPGWQTETWETCFEHPYASFCLYKPTWEFYWIELQLTDYGEKTRLGIVRYEDLISDRPLTPEVLETVRKLFPSAKSGKWWEAVMILRSPATDWRPPEVLWRMHSDTSFLDAVADQMLRLAQATGAVLDRLNKKQERTK